MLLKSSHLLLAIHGSRDDLALAQAESLRQTMTAKGDWIAVEVGWLQFLTPSVDVALERLIAAGARRIVVAPLFILSGRHVDSDLPAIVVAARQRHPECEIVLGGPLVASQRFTNSLTEYCRDLTYGAAPPSASEPPDATV